MSFSVKELFYSLQGEGAQTGRPAVFCRFAGCNLWSGREQDRATAVCSFCDTDFVGVDGQNGGKFATEEALAQAIQGLWQAKADTSGKPYVVFTGGEPMLQLTESLVAALHAVNFDVALETNGTLAVPENVDWICVSPKADTEIVQRSGHELKLVYPQAENSPEQFAHWAFVHFYLQPLDGVETTQNAKRCVEYCLEHPQWRLSLQTHKWLGID